MGTSLIHSYLRETGRDLATAEPGFLAYLANLDMVAQRSSSVAAAIVAELRDQRANLKLIASENYCSLPVQCAMANLLTDKYAEGVPANRFYAGCDNVDRIEELARQQACLLFGAEHAYVQPHSGADANLIAYWAILSKRIETPALAELGATSIDTLSAADWNALRERLGNQRLLGMNFYSGGHLTHGYRRNVSGRLFEAHSYSVDPQTGLLSYDEIERQAQTVRPLILLAGYSAYPRLIDFSRLRQIADRVGAVLMVDMAHFAGLVAGKAFTGPYDPVPYADVVTSTTHKTLRGPRGGLVLCRQEFAESVDKGCPLVQGGPLPHVMAAKALCFAEALEPEFRSYAAQIVKNSRALAEALARRGAKIVTGGTDNHLLLVNVTPFGLTGRQGETALRECGVTLNRNAIPCNPDGTDPNGPWYTSGLRLGTAAVTTLEMLEPEMDKIAEIMLEVLKHTTPETTPKGRHKAKYAIADNAKAQARARVSELMRNYRLYPEIDLEFLIKSFPPEDHGA
ncbi:MAG: glycine hydroxymethyltransferase [candidate division Zixibacteria bacterium]|nr:glycine hydroxymethyltransferase [candidate division Zixibacteria bacterium]